MINARLTDMQSFWKWCAFAWRQISLEFDCTYILHQKHTHTRSSHCIILFPFSLYNFTPIPVRSFSQKQLAYGWWNRMRVRIRKRTSIDASKLHLRHNSKSVWIKLHFNSVNILNVWWWYFGNSNGVEYGT